VRGVKGLRGIDSSIMPTVVSGDPHASTVAIAERGSGFVLRDART
jgi:choline dehydrogenase